MHYKMVIEWSEEDQAYIVTLPEFWKDGLIGHTHGSTYEEAAREGTEMLELVIETWKGQGRPLPEPKLFKYRSH